MSNPLFGDLMKNNQSQNLIAQFEQFKKNFTGDPKQQVEQLLSSGRMTQEQFNRLSQMATQFQSLLGR